MPAHMAYPQSHALLHDWGPGRGRTRSIHEWMERARRPPQKYARFRTSVCTGSATGPSAAPRRRGAAEPTSDSVVHAPRPITQPSRSLAPGSIDARRARRGGSDGEAARAATARRPTWPRTPLVPRILPPQRTPPPSFSNQSPPPVRRRAAVCRVAPRPPSPILSPTSPLHNIYSRDAHTAP